MVALGVLVLVVCGSLGFRAVSAERAATLVSRPAMDPSQATGVLATGQWSVWRTLEMHGDRSDHHRRSQWVRYFRQRAGGERAALIFETHETSLKPMAVLADGTVVFARPNQEHLVMVDRRGAVYQTDLSLEIGGERRPAMINAVVEDGVVAQPRPPRGFGADDKAPMLLIPFRNGRPDTSAAIPMTEGEAVAMRPQRAVGRHWPRLAWVDERGLFTFDLITHQAREINFDADVERGFDEVRAFDGRFIVLRRHIVDTDTGKSVARLKDNHPITLHDGVMYEMRDPNKRGQLAIIARDLTADPNQPHELITFDGFTVYWQYNSHRYMRPNMAPAMTEPLPEGLRVFDGERWVIVPHVDRDAPAEDQDTP